MRRRFVGKVRVLGCALAVTVACDGAVTQADPSSTEIAAHVFECGAPQPCPVLGFQFYGPDNPPSVPSAEEYRCNLDLLKARTPSLIVTSEGCEGTCSGQVYLVREDGSALVQPWYAKANDEPGMAVLNGQQVDFPSFAENGARCALRAPSFYESCDFGESGDCDSVSEWFVDCAPPSEEICEP